MGAIKKIKKIVRPKKSQADEQAQAQTVCVCPTPTESFQYNLSKHIRKNG